MSSRRKRNHRRKAIATSQASTAAKLANQKTEAEIRKIEADIKLARKRFRLDVFKAFFATGGVVATVATILIAIFGT